MLYGENRRLALAYVRGMARLGAPEVPRALTEKPLDALSEAEGDALLAAGQAAGLKLYYFKQKEELPRVRQALGFLRAIQPESLLDVGSGRGVFLFPFLRAFPDTPVTSVDLLERRVALMQALRDGGIDNLEARRASICDWDAPAGSFGVVTLLEVLEHIPDVGAAVKNAVRLSRRYVTVSVPSKPDDNPEHIHLLTRPVLTELFAGAGCTDLKFDGVNGHLFLVAKAPKG